MNLYVESSAVLAWLLRETPAPLIKEILGGADSVVASELTLIECDRVLIQAEVVGRLTPSEASERKALLEASSSRWMFVRIEGEVLERARHRFPKEPVKTLDALHLASALAARSAVSDLALLSLDQRVRENGAALGFDILPA